MSTKPGSFLITTIVTVFYAAVLGIAKIILNNPIDWIELLIGAIVFWIAFFLVRDWFSKKTEKKKLSQKR